DLPVERAHSRAVPSAHAVARKLPSEDTATHVIACFDVSSPSRITAPRGNVAVWPPTTGETQANSINQEQALCGLNSERRGNINRSRIFFEPIMKLFYYTEIGLIAANRRLQSFHWASRNQL